jgi:chaperonin cofactor prefoldin
MLLFKDVKQNYPVFILDKLGLTLSQGKVAQISFPYLDSSKPSLGMVVDVTILANSKTATYTIPESLSVTEAGPNLILSTDKSALTNEIEAMKSNAEAALNSIDRQKEIIAKSSKLLSELNPVYKDKVQYEERFKSLESNMSDIKSMLAKLFNETDNKRRND